MALGAFVAAGAAFGYLVIALLALIRSAAAPARCATRSRPTDPPRRYAGGGVCPTAIATATLRRRASSALMISRPSGAIARPASLNDATPNGITMIVMHSPIP